MRTCFWCPWVDLGGGSGEGFQTKPPLFKCPNLKPCPSGQQETSQRTTCKGSLLENWSFKTYSLTQTKIATRHLKRGIAKNSCPLYNNSASFRGFPAFFFFDAFFPHAAWNDFNPDEFRLFPQVSHRFQCFQWRLQSFFLTFILFITQRIAISQWGKWGILFNSSYVYKPYIY